MKPSTDKRLLRFTLDVSMWLVIIGLVALPLVLIGVGLVQSALSELMFNESNVPLWVYVAQLPFLLSAFSYLKSLPSTAVLWACTITRYD